jgi:acylphosphatase
MTEDRIARRLRIHGRVQGVYYRGWTVDAAAMLGLDGWVRNRMDGTVEALVAGPQASVEALIEACRKGPPAARVDLVETEEAIGIVASGFTQKPTV